MTATPDKRDDNVEGHNVYELFNYQIAYEIRLQQAMEENLLCPFHYFGITDISIIDDDKERDFSVLTCDEYADYDFDDDYDDDYDAPTEDTRNLGRSAKKSKKGKKTDDYDVDFIDL